MSGMLYITAVSLALSTDIFAVAVARSFCVEKTDTKYALIMSLSFAFFHILLLSIGYFGGYEAKNVILGMDHWISFALLSFVGAKMIIESFSKDGKKEEKTFKSLCAPKTLFVISLATSVDAFAVGVSFSFSGTSLVYSCIVLGLITASVSFAGAMFGRKLGSFFGKRAELIGGLALIAIGFKMLISHSV